MSQQKNVFITGVTSGIGKACAIKFLKKGYFVYGTYNKNKNEAYNLQKKYNKTKLIKVNLAKRNQTLKVVKQLKGVKLHGLVNNAGFFYEDNIFNKAMDKWDLMLEGMLTAPIILTKGLVGNLQKYSSIVNICSIYGTKVYPGDSLGYLASKSALSAITKALSVDLSPKNIRVNAIAPGVVNTPIHGGLSKQSLIELTKETPVNKVCTSKDIANVVYFLNTKKSFFINGEVIIADGGHTNYNSFFS